METVVTISPTSEPLTLADAKEHLRVLHDDDDTYIEALASTARQYIENTEGVSLASQTLRSTFDGFPCEPYIELPRTPVSSVTSVQYVDTSGELQTLSSDDYSLDTSSNTSRVVLDHGVTWPSTRCVPNAVRVTYVAGFSTLPKPYMHAMKLLASHWYENREPVNIGNIVNVIPYAVQALLASVSKGVYR